MKRILAIILLLLITGGLWGCGNDTQEKSGVFYDKNDILLYEKIDAGKTVLYVSMLGKNSQVLSLAEAFEKNNPDVQVVCLDITGGDGDYCPLEDWIVHGLTPDLMFTNNIILRNMNSGADYLVDLSAHPALESFEVASLDALAVDGKVYYLPGPSEVNCICYNKTMFEEYGWEVPDTFDEFVALCLKITEDTHGEVQPWNPNAKYVNVFSIAMQGFTYGELFGNVDKRTWYNNFCAGKETFAGHMEPMYAHIQTLIDNGLLREEHFTYSATTRGEEFADGKIAMINNQASGAYRGEKFETGYMPFPSTDGETGYVCGEYSMMISVPKKEHTEKEQDALDRLIMYFASADGQLNIVGDKLLISNVKNMPYTNEEALAPIISIISQGNVFSYMLFDGAGNRNWSFREGALKMLEEGKTGAEIIKEIDEMPYLTKEESAAQPANVIAQVAEDFNSLDFSFYIADMYRQTAGADIGLINHAVAYRGNLVRLFKGDMYEKYVRVLMPRSFENGSALTKVSMTGAQLMDALNNPGATIEESHNSVYAFSGLKCKIAPLNAPGKKCLSVKLEDGSAIDPEKLYTVAIWAGTVADEYITEVLETYPGTWTELMKAKMISDNTLSPARDGRITLTWD